MKKPTPEQTARVERLRALLDIPLSEIERRRFACDKARIRAEDERKRQPIPQLQLEVA